MIHWLTTAINTYLLHPLHGNGYQYHSGLGSDWSELTLLGLVVAWWRSHNCHVKRCPRLQWHVHPDHGHPVCRKHHPDDGVDATERPWKGQADL